ncbi:MAG: site-2 protease family protein [Candidatus Saccharimonadales bacterium]|jgi:Zn-dependent protease
MLTSLTALEKVFFVVSLILTIPVHEAMHGYMAHWLGDDTAEVAGRLTLNPLKHIDPFTTILLPTVMVLLGLPPLMVAKPVPFNPYRVKFGEYGAALVGLAGPLSNILIAIIASVFLRIEAVNLSINVIQFLEILIDVNVALFIINMIPIPPLDGSRVLYAFAPEPLQKIMQRIESFGFTSIIFIFLIIFLFFGQGIYSLEVHLVNILLG